ncbi:RING-type E3 ubiquitin transferase [Salvia divinorum]|uniref:RING-type E3 ubiquitin transferase n=1 Tax=Salvia divinorum TaxID=28513 RepID=A0ABD1HFG4_SALDI
MGLEIKENRISPSLLLTIIIVAVIFFISGLLHLLARFLLRRNSDESESSTALEGQLQQLFHLHDSGLDQSFIDTLPVFNYKAIIGLKDPFDCAVCLSEFEVEDTLRLLPKCSHAFHVDCIDTWLLSHSTCPICRASLEQEFSFCCSPVVRVLESENSAEIDLERQVDDGEKSGENGERVVPVKLGKFWKVDGGGGEGGAEARRCFSMGSFSYVMKENSSLKVAISSHVNKRDLKRRGLGHRRMAMSECGCDSRREFNGFDAFKVVGAQSGGNGDDSSFGLMSKRESFSLSKIWLTDKGGDTAVENTRRAFSFRLPTHRSAAVEGGADAKNGGGGGGVDFDEEIGMQRD